MKKILVFGALGMFGHIAVQYLRSVGEYEVVACARHIPEKEGISADVTDFAHVERILREQKPDIVLNAVGMLVKACADRPDMAILLNSYFPHFLARMGAGIGYKLVHISTDCVFSGQKGGYKDTDFRDGDTMYDRSKALGEIIDDRNLTIRTSIIGPELKSNGTGLFHWFMHQHGEIKGYTHAYWSGVTTLELSKFVHAALKQNLTGLFQLSMPEKISKYSLLELFKDIWQYRDIEILPFEGFFCDKSMIITQNPSIHYDLPINYREMLLEMKAWTGKHIEL